MFIFLCSLLIAPRLKPNLLSFSGAYQTGANLLPETHLQSHDSWHVMSQSPWTFSKTSLCSYAYIFFPPFTSLPRKCLPFLRGLTKILQLVWNSLWSLSTVQAKLIKDLRCPGTSFSFILWNLSCWTVILLPSWEHPESRNCLIHHHSSLKYLVFHTPRKTLLVSFLTHWDCH